jgi:hypothetical protein
MSRGQGLGIRGQAPPALGPMLYAICSMLVSPFPLCLTPCALSLQSIQPIEPSIFLPQTSDLEPLAGSNLTSVRVDNSGNSACTRARLDRSR